MKITTKLNKKTGLFLTLLLIIVLVSGTLTPLTYAENNINKEIIRTARGDLKDVALNKLDSKVLDVLDTEGYIEVLVYLRDQVDTKSVARATRNSVSSKTTPYKTKLEVRKGVVEALQDKAEKTQVNLLRYIEQEKKKGNVKEYEEYYIVNMLYVKATKEVIENISYMPEVKRIYKNEFIKLEKPIRSEVCIESVREGGLEWNIEKVGANYVWDMGIDGTGAVVGLIDTGVAWEHPALKEKWRGYNLKTGSVDPDGNWFDAVNSGLMPYDIPSIPHGTHVLGTILGQEPDGSNKIGVAPGAKWIAAKAFSEGGGYDNDLIAAGEWMLAPGGDPTKAPDVINNSWGGGATKDDWFREIVRNWRAAEIVPIFAAGNQKMGETAPWPGSIENPANYPESFAVAATDKNNNRASFSKLGPSPYDEGLIKPEISAPGVNIRSSVPGGYENDWSGTSMATPHVTGAVALLVSMNSSLGADKIEEIIENTAIGLTDDTYPNSPNFGFGYGLVNAFEAIASQIAGTGFINGKVLIEGEDLREPIIEHVQKVKDAYIGSNIEVTANISDDISILDVKLLVKADNETDWKSVKMGRISGDYKNGEYAGTIAPDMLGQIKTIYRIMAKDYAGKTVTTEDYCIDTKFGIIPDKYETDFETQPIGWRFTGDWEWGEPKGGVGPRPHSGKKLVGTVLNGMYSNESDSYLITPPIDLRDETLGSATLRFYQWYEIETSEYSYDDNYDKGQIYISNDNGENWIKTGQEYNGDGKEWHEILINLEEYIGSRTPVYVAFCFASDSKVQKDGWYLDDVRLVGEDKEPPTVPKGLTSGVTLAGIKLSWESVPEADLDKYKIYRSEVPGGEYTRIGETLKTSFIDDTVEGENNYYYVVTAVDFSGNESDYSEEVSETAPNLEIFLNSDFETDNGGFTTGVAEAGYNNCWEWGVPKSGPGKALTGTKVWATNLSGNYGSDSRCYIESPAITIPEDVTTALFFDHWVNTEVFYGIVSDYGKVQISTDGGRTWKDITDEIGGHRGKWEGKEINLAEYSGKTIKIRFFFYSDYSTEYEGWYIDNIVVSGIYKPDISEVLITESIVSDDKTTQRVKGNKPLRSEHAEPEGLKFSLTNDKTTDYEIITDGFVEGIITGRIPADAIITVVETGKSVKTDLATGGFSMRHVANKEGEIWTLRAESYGYYPKEIGVYLEEEGEVYEAMFLDKIPQGTIAGRVLDRHAQNPITDAVIKIKEDPRVVPVKTDGDGNFRIEGIPEGNYTLKVKANGFVPNETSVAAIGNQVIEKEITLMKFVGYEAEIGYDDGTFENGVVLTDSGDGAAVKITPSGYGRVNAANIFFYPDEWPYPGGDEIGIAIFDTNDSGKVGNMVGEPKIVMINRGEWNLIDLSQYEFITDRDFFIATVQTKIDELSPGVGIDKYCKEPRRSYLHIGGGFIPIGNPDIDLKGGLMIRGIMEYLADLPKITNLEGSNYTNRDRITVRGTVGTDSKINVYINGEKSTETETENKEFAVEVDLKTDESIIAVTAEFDGRETELSKPVRIIKDKTAPILKIIKPLDGGKINKELVVVEGSVLDEHPDKLLVNGEETRVDIDGSFSKKILVDEGENIIFVEAIDLAGNRTIETIRVIVKLESETLKNIQPAEDITLRAGDVLTVSFNASTGGKGNFAILSGITTSGQNSGVPLTECKNVPGLYEGSWTIPEGFIITDGLIEIEFVDAVGNKTTGTAPGRITTVPTTGFEHMENLPLKTVIIGKEAFDIVYLNNNVVAQKKLIDRYRQQKEIYIKFNKDTIADIRGIMQGIDVLPEEITYYGANGNVIIYFK